MANIVFEFVGSQPLTFLRFSIEGAFNDHFVRFMAIQKKQINIQPWIQFKNNNQKVEVVRRSGTIPDCNIL